MEDLRITLSKLTVCSFITCALVVQCVGLADENEIGESRAGLRLVTQIATEFPNMVTRDANGVLIGLTVPGKYYDDHSLRVISAIPSIRTLKLIGNARGRGPTVEGIKYLERMTNLMSLAFACFQKQGLGVGVFYSASKIGQLKEFQLYFAEAPSGEYRSLTNMLELTRLELHFCFNFRDAELKNLTKLTKLRQLALIDTGVTRSGTNMLKGLVSITNLYVRVRKAG
jgi:hypothetical protein